MADLNALQAQRKQILNEIQRRGGAAKAPNFAKQLAAIESQIRAARGGGDTGTVPTGTAGDAVNPGINATTNNVIQGQKDLANAGGDIALQALKGTQLNQAFNPTLTDRPLTGQLEADRNRIENDVYGHLTRNLDQDYQLARQQREQTLVNKGIPFSADPNSRYQQELGRMDQQYADTKIDARRQATQLGGAEYQRAFDIGETLRNNQFTEQAGIRNQQSAEAAALGSLGVGSVAAFEQLSQAEKDRALQKYLAEQQNKTALQVARMRSSGGGGGGGENLSDSPFNSNM